MMHLQAHLGKTSKTANSMWTSTSSTCIGLHAGILCSDVQTWYIGSSCTLILRRSHWPVLVGRRFLPSGYRIMMRCMRCRGLWSPWRHPSAYPVAMATLEISWRNGWTSQLNLGWHPTRSTRRRYCERLSILGHLYMSSIWPRRHGNLPNELGDHLGLAGQRRRSMQMV